MSAPTLVEFEVALESALEELVTAGYVRTVSSYVGQLKDLLTEEGFDGNEIWIHIDEADEAGHTTGSYKVEPTIQLFIAAQNYRDDDSRRRGVDAAGEVGSLQLLELVFGKLAGADLDLEITPLTPLGFHAVVVPEQTIEIAASVYRYDWRTSWTRPRPAEDAVDHITSHMEYDAGADDITDLESTVTHTEAE